MRGKGKHKAVHRDHKHRSQIRQITYHFLREMRDRLHSYHL